MKKATFATLLVLAMLLTQCFAIVFADSAWYCPKCGRKNYDNFCPADGTARPSDLGGTSTAPATVSTKLRAGSHVYLGHYEQDNDISSGKEQIEWIVLEVREGKALLVSRYVLEGMQFDKCHDDVTWINSDLRYWLNSTFIRTAFSSAEQNAILSTSMPEGCVDEVFLLSRKDAEQYFPTDAERKAVATPYTADKIYHQVNGTGENATCRWWLRTIGQQKHCAMYVFPQGNIAVVGLTDPGYNLFPNESQYNWIGVRPAMWVDITSGLF